MRDLAIAAACLCVASIVLAGCSAREDRSAHKPKVALVMKSLANEFFKTMEDGARQHQAGHPDQYDLLANGIKDEQDVDRQVALVEQMIAQKADAIVIAPADSKALVPICKKAMDQGIVVVNIDNKFDAAALAEKNAKIPFVGPDNCKGARLAGDCLAQKLKAGDKVAIVEGVPSAFNAVQRRLGFEGAMKACGANVVSSQSANWMPDQAERVVSGMITQHPDLKAVLCANDNMALGAVAALKSAGKADQVLVTGYDNISAVGSLIKEGKILCTVDQHADKIAVFGIEYALDILGGKVSPADKETAVDIVTAQTGAPGSK
jgi:ribose transport system substrate-binding protein